MDGTVWQRSTAITNFIYSQWWVDYLQMCRSKRGKYSSIWRQRPDVVCPPIHLQHKKQKNQPSMPEPWQFYAMGNLYIQQVSLLFIQIFQGKATLISARQFQITPVKEPMSQTGLLVFQTCHSLKTSGPTVYETNKMLSSDIKKVFLKNIWWPLCHVK